MPAPHFTAKKSRPAGANAPRSATPPQASAHGRVSTGLPRFAPVTPVPTAAAQGLRVNRPGDAFETEAQRAAEAVVAGRAATVTQTAGAFSLQREESQTGPATKKEPSQEDNYKAAGKKIGEALIETKAGKELKAKAEALGKEFLGTVEGKVLTGVAIGGALSALIATNGELPVAIPEIPLDFIAPGLKAKLTWEGPVRTPTNVSLTLTSASGLSIGAGYSESKASPGKPAEEKGVVTVTIPLGPAPKKPKGAKSDQQKYRDETARLAAEQAKFREGLKPAAERKAEDDEFWRIYWQSKGLVRRTDESLMLMRQAHADTAGGGIAPPLVHDVLRAPGQSLDAATRAFMEPRFGHDLSHVRLHTDARAAASAEAVSARAYTVGHHVVFGPGAFAPSTPDGRKLLAHELTHTLQQRAAPAAKVDAPLPIAAATSPAEKEADAVSAGTWQGRARFPLQPAARQVARQPAPTTAAAPANSVFANEDPALRQRRLAVIAFSQPLIKHLRDALARGYVWPFETVTANEITSQITLTKETFAVREARLRQLMIDLELMSSELASAPIPYGWTAHEVRFTRKDGGGSMAVEWNDPKRTALKDTKMFYAHRGQAAGADQTLLMDNWSHLEMPPRRVAAVRRAQTRSATDTGIYLVVPDSKNAPLVYHRLTGYEGWRSQGVIVTVWNDDAGYFYYGHDGKIYLPERP